MCETGHYEQHGGVGQRIIPVHEAIGTVLAHDITEIRRGEFKGRAFKKGHIVRQEDVSSLQKLGKENLFVLNLARDEMHEDEAVYALAGALMGRGVEIRESPREGKIDIVASRDGLLRIDKTALLRFNMVGEVMCATLHDCTMVKKGQTVAGTRAIPLVIRRSVVEEAVASAQCEHKPIRVDELRKPRAGIVITGNEVYHGRIKDAFAPVISEKLLSYDSEIVGIRYAPDDEAIIQKELRELINLGADLLITTGGMSVDPDDVTRFAIRSLGAADFTYGSAVLPGAMFLIAYLKMSRNGNGCSYNNDIPVLGIPACGMYASTTVFDLVLPRVLSGERVGRRQLAELGHGGLCMKCAACTYPRCPFGKQ